jgi:hypothetical protein
MCITIRRYCANLFLATLLLSLSACSSARNGERRDNDEEEEREHVHLTRTPEAWGSGLSVSRFDRTSDTVTFHIGSPLFIRLTDHSGRACSPFNGQPFYFDASGVQLGWMFEEVADSVLFPRADGGCDRVVMLSSENSNGLAEGYYTMKAELFVDEKTRLYSDTIVLHPVHAPSADEESYASFLQEQIVRHSPMLAERETLQALFAEGVPTSAESEIYRALILARAGDISGAEQALQASAAYEKKAGRALASGVVPTREAVKRYLLESAR